MGGNRKHSVDIGKLHTELFINGKFVKSSDGGTFDTINPSDETVITSVQKATEKDVENAIDAAVKAFECDSEWRKLSAFERGQLLQKLGDKIEEKKEYFAEIETLDNGKPLSRDGDKYGSMVDVELVIKIFKYYGGWCDKIMGNTIPIDGDMFCCTVREPVGPCGQIIPWNYPLLMAAWKLAPCLAAGCTTVLKTSSKTPLSVLQLCELISDVGFPPGVVNVISGSGSLGEILAKSDKLKKVAFTGSTAVGHNIMKNAAESNLKRVSLELGGKSPVIICDDADLDKAVDVANTALFMNHGQNCAAGSRIFVQANIYDEFVKKCAAKAEKITVGDGFDSNTEQGPQIAKGQFEKIMDFIKSGVQEGARLVAGGKRIGSSGYFIAPTVFADVKDDMKIAKEEIFGPVQSLFKFETFEEVMKRANDTMYGLAAGIVTKDVGNCFKIAKGLRAGTVWVNCYNVFGPQTPFGGFKQSGHGREKGYEGLENYIETKTIILPH